MAKSILGLRRKWAGAALLSALLGSMMVAQPASAAGYTVTGKVQCANSASPVGIWVTANNGGSGFASTWLDVSDGWGFIHYSKSIPNGGSFYLSVGCGGSPQSWGMTASSNTYATSQLNLVCNDIPWYLSILARWYPYIGNSLNPAVPYGRCLQI